MKKLNGILLVAAGACSYGVLATIVKYTYGFGVATSILNFSQFLIGFLVLCIMSFFGRKDIKQPDKVESKNKFKLVLFGSSLGLTSVFYYMSIQYVPVSIGIILLMQTIWMGVALEAVLNRKRISGSKALGSLVVIIGTILATDILKQDASLDVKGISLGLLAAICYTLSIYSSNSVSAHLAPIDRSKYLVLGGLLAIIVFWNVQIINHFDLLTLLKWGTPLALFGTILPPILFTKGMPITGVGLGSILGAVEIPVSIFSAYIILNEQVSLMQWIGVLIVLVSVILINSKNIKGNL